VKNLHLALSMMAALCVVILLGASSWSPDTTWYHFNIFGGKFWFFHVFFFSIFGLLYKRFSSPPYIGLAIVALFIKRGKRLFQARLEVRHHQHRHSNSDLRSKL
jgi:hypothetical protein